MPVSLNTSDALFAALSRLYLVDDDNAVKELKTGATLTVNAAVKTPASGSTTGPVGRSFRTTGSGATPQGISFTEYVASSAGPISVFISINQMNGGQNAGANRAAMGVSASTVGVTAGTGWQMEIETGRFSPHNTNGGAALSTLTLTTGSLTAPGVKSFGFVRNGGAGAVKAYINGQVDPTFAGGLANTGSPHNFGAAWTNSAVGLIGGQAGNSWVSGDYVHWCEFIGTALTDADFQRLHDSLTGNNAFALVSVPADVTPPTLTGSITVSLLATTSYTLSWPAGADSGGSGLAGYDYSLDAGATWNTLGNVTTVNVTGRSPGTTDQVRVRARDGGGLTSSPELSASVTLLASGDTTPPVLTGSITIAAGTVTQTGCQADWPAATDSGGSGLAGYDLSTDGGATWPLSWPVNNFTFSGLSPSTTYQLRVRARDGAGNLSAVISGSVTTLAAVHPTITGSVLKNNAGTVLASVACEAFVNNAETGALVVKKTGLTTSGAGVPSFSDAALVAGQAYSVRWRLTATGAEGLEALTAAA